MSEYSQPLTVTSLSVEPVALWVALLAAGTVATIAWRCNALTGPRALAASIVGVAVMSGTGWGGGIVLGTFGCGLFALFRSEANKYYLFKQYEQEIGEYMRWKLNTELGSFVRRGLDEV